MRKTYFIIYKTGIGQIREEEVSSLEDAKKILVSMYEIDRGSGCEVEWTSAVAFVSYTKLPNGKATKSKCFIKAYWKNR